LKQVVLVPSFFVVFAEEYSFPFLRLQSEHGLVLNELGQNFQVGSSFFPKKTLVVRPLPCV